MLLLRITDIPFLGREVREGLSEETYRMRRWETKGEFHRQRKYQAPSHWVG